MSELGLFPLPIVLVPTERIPLHIFEPRYLELIAECVETDSEFGLVLGTGDGAVHEVGTRAAVVEVLEVLEDGRMNIVIEGRDRFRLVELTRGRSFRTAVVEPVSDDPDPADPAAIERALELFRRLAKVAESDVDVPAADSDRWTTSSRPESTSASTRSRSCSRRHHRGSEWSGSSSCSSCRSKRSVATAGSASSPVATARSRPPALDHDPAAAAPGVAGRRERTVRQHLDGVRAAEEEVVSPPADDVVADLLEPVELCRVEPALAMEVGLVDMDARAVDRLRDAERVGDDVRRSPA